MFLLLRMLTQVVPACAFQKLFCLLDSYYRSVDSKWLTRSSLNVLLPLNSFGHLRSILSEFQFRLSTSC